MVFWIEFICTCISRCDLLENFEMSVSSKYELQVT